MRYVDISDRIKKALDDAGMNQNELSIASGVSRASISQYVNGKNSPSSINAVKMAQVLRVSPEWLMGLDIDSDKTAFTVPEYDYIVNDILIEIQELNLDQKKQLLDMARFLAYQNSLQNQANTNKEN